MPARPPNPGGQVRIADPDADCKRPWKSEAPCDLDPASLSTVALLELAGAAHEREVARLQAELAALRAELDKALEPESSSASGGEEAGLEAGIHESWVPDATEPARGLAPFATTQPPPPPPQAREWLNLEGEQVTVQDMIEEIDEDDVVEETGVLGESEEAEEAVGLMGTPVFSSEQSAFVAEQSDKEVLAIGPSRSLKEAGKKCKFDEMDRMPVGMVRMEAEKPKPRLCLEEKEQEKKPTLGMRSLAGVSKPGLTFGSKIPSLKDEGSAMTPKPPLPSLTAVTCVEPPPQESPRAGAKLAFAAEPEHIPAARGLSAAIGREFSAGKGEFGKGAAVRELPRNAPRASFSSLNKGPSATELGRKEEPQREEVALKMFKTWNRALMSSEDSMIGLSLSRGADKRRSSLGIQFQQAHMKREKTRLGQGMTTIEGTAQTTQTTRSAIDRFAIAPNALRRIWWNSIGLACILSDLITIPLQVFEIGPSPVMSIIAFGFTLFWTVDLVLNFFTGYYCKSGIIELRVKKIAKNYLKSWFAPDLSLALIDWMVFSAEVAADNIAVLRIGKSMRLGKSLRLLRLARIAKMDGMWADVMKQVNSEEFNTIAALVVRLGNILICSHWIACMWYGQTLLTDGSTWVKHHLADVEGMRDEASFQYTASLHWTLTQFTPASMEVYPHNLRERVLTIMVLLFGLITFTSLISRISNAMSHLQTMNAAHFIRQHKLRAWLRENSVSMNLVARVWACIKESSKQNRRTPQKDVALLTLLPKSIMAELYHEIFEPVLQTHPFLGVYMEHNMFNLRQVCGIVTEVYLFAGDELFTSGDTASKAFFLRGGTVLYDTDPLKVMGALEQATTAEPETYSLTRCTTKIVESMQKSKPVVTPGQWISEVALWAEWIYRGPAVAAEYSELVSLGGQGFRDIMSKSVQHDHMLGKYASLFCQRAVHELPTLDVWFDSEVLEDLAWCAFFEGADFSECIPSKNTEMTDSEEEDDDDDSDKSETVEEATLKIPKAAPNEASEKEVRQALAEWHSRVRDMREEEEEEEAIEEHTGWLWNKIMPNLRDSMGPGGRTSLSARQSRHSKKARHSSMAKKFRGSTATRDSWCNSTEVTSFAIGR